jgi:hypothetical protein
VRIFLVRHKAYFSLTDPFRRCVFAKSEKEHFLSFQALGN